MAPSRGKSRIMSRTRQLLTTAVSSLFLLFVAGPAFAGPAPLDERTSGNGAGTATVPTNDGSSIWTYIGYAAAVLLVIGLVAVASIAVARHTHQHAPHPA
jgi:Ni/Fe-hydrogenase subunit HybB-like protein